METNVDFVFLMKTINLVSETRFVLLSQLDKLKGCLDQQGLYEPDTAKRVLIKFESEYNILAVDPAWRELARQYCKYVKRDMCSSHDVKNIEGDFGVSLLFQYGDESYMLAEWEAYDFWKVWKTKQSNINRKKVN